MSLGVPILKHFRTMAEPTYLFDSFFFRKEGFEVPANSTIADLNRGAGLRLVVDRSNETNSLFTYDSTKIAFVTLTNRLAFADSMWVHEIDFYPADAIYPSGQNHWRFRRWSTDNKFEYEDRPITSSGEVVHPNEYVTPANWIIDPCWELVYISRSDRYGNNWGSIASLLWYIRQGHKVRAIFEGVSMEADTILIRNNQITAQFVSQVARSGRKMFWVWQLVSTTGRIQTVTNDVGTNNRIKHADTNKRIEWYVDTRRWREILSQRTNYDTGCGSRSAYTHSVQSGHDIRLALHYRHYSVYVTPDSVGKGAHLQASFNRGVGYKIDWKSSDEFKFHLPPHWDFFFLRSGPSSYFIRRLRRIVGTRIPATGAKRALRSVQWFANW